MDNKDGPALDGLEGDTKTDAGEALDAGDDRTMELHPPIGEDLIVGDDPEGVAFMRGEAKGVFSPNVVEPPGAFTVLLTEGAQGEVLLLDEVAPIPVA